MNNPPRCLIVVRAGDNSLHEGWLAPPGEREFDLAVSYYGRTAGRWAERADHYSVQPGPKWPCVADWLDANWSWVSGYDFVAFPDDDLSATSTVWSSVFEVMSEHSLDLAQPSFAPDSNWCHPITAQRTGGAWRVTNFIENGLAVFSRRALLWCAATLRLGSSGVGTDYAWAAIVRRNGGRVGIVDRVAVEHVRAHHGAGATVHQSSDALASVLPHPEMFDELLLMATFGIGNPYDPFVEATDGPDEPVDSPRPPDTPPAPNPVSFVVVGSGPLRELIATVDSVIAARAPGDELVVVDATFDSHLADALGARTANLRLVVAADQGLAESYDIALATARQPVAVVISPGWELESSFRGQVSDWLDGDRPDLIVAASAAAGVLDRVAVAAIGGMRLLSQHVTTGFGKVGTQDLLRAARAELDRRGHRVATAAFAAVAITPAPAAESGTQDLPAGTAVTRWFPPGLLGAVEPTGLTATLSMFDIVSDDEAHQYTELAATKWAQLSADFLRSPDRWPPELRAAVARGPFRTARLAHALMRRNTVAQAANLLETRGLPAGSPPPELEEAVLIMRAAGKGPEKLLVGPDPTPPGSPRSPRYPTTLAKEPIA